MLYVGIENKVDKTIQTVTATNSLVFHALKDIQLFYEKNSDVLDLNFYEVCPDSRLIILTEKSNVSNLQTLFGKTSHDIKNHLTIMGTTAMIIQRGIKKDKIDSEKFLRLLNSIEASVENVVNLLNDYKKLLQAPRRKFNYSFTQLSKFFDSEVRLKLLNSEVNHILELPPIGNEVHFQTENACFMELVLCVIDSILTNQFIKKMKILVKLEYNTDNKNIIFKLSVDETNLDFRTMNELDKIGLQVQGEGEKIYFDSGISYAVHENRLCIAMGALKE